MAIAAERDQVADSVVGRVAVDVVMLTVLALNVVNLRATLVARPDRSLTDGIRPDGLIDDPLATAAAEQGKLKLVPVV